MTVAVLKEFFTETELLQIEKIFETYKPIDEWDDSYSVGSRYGTESTNDSRIAKSIILRPEKFPVELKEKILYNTYKVIEEPVIFHEALSVQRYMDTDNGRFDWHQDTLNFFLFQKSDINSSAEHVFLKNTRPKRKVSISIALNDRDEYEGGQFVIDMGDGQKTPVDLDRGDMVMFTSNTFHGVEPVTKGERQALIIWLISNEEYQQWKQLCDIDTERE